MSTPNEQFNIHAEPVAPTIGFRGSSFTKQAGDSDRRTADYAAWMQDIEERKARSAAFEAKRQQNKPQEPKVELSAVDEVLNALEEAAEDFEQTHLKPNFPFIEARNEVERLRAELAEAEDRLNAIEARGDSVQRLTNAVRSAESQLQALVSRAETEEVAAIARDHYGWDIPWNRISDENKKDFRNHASVIALKQFYVPRSIVHPKQTPSVRIAAITVTSSRREAHGAAQAPRDP
jgi:predicted RNase H-like nuclease (RuvC/YqgF family)